MDESGAIHSAQGAGANDEAILNYGAVAKETRNPKMQQFLEMVEAVGPDVKELKNVARDERPFVPELTWAYYSAFSTVLHFSLCACTH